MINILTYLEHLLHKECPSWHEADVGDESFFRQQARCEKLNCSCQKILNEMNAYTTKIMTGTIK